MKIYVARITFTPRSRRDIVKIFTSLGTARNSMSNTLYGYEDHQYNATIHEGTLDDLHVVDERGRMSEAIEGQDTLF